jgi:hypothetical protein
VKPPKRAGSPAPPDRSVAWWSVLLLIALALVLTALFFSGRFVLSLDAAQQQNAALPRLMAERTETERFGAKLDSWRSWELC